MPLGQPSSLGQPRRRQPGGGSSSGGPSGSCGGGIKHITPAPLQQRDGHGLEWVGGTPEGNPWWAGRLGPQRTFDPPPPRSGGPSGNGSGNEGLLEKDEAASNEDESDVEETSACCPDCGYEDWLMFQACPACSPDEAFKASPGRDRSRTPRRHRQPRPRRNPKLRRQERLLPNAWVTQLFNLAKAAGNDSIEVALYEDADEAAAEDDEDGAGIAEEAAEDAEEAAEDEDADKPLDEDDAGIAEEAAEDEDADVDTNDEAAASAESAVVRVVAPAPRTPPKSKPTPAPLLLRPVPKATLATLLLLRPASHGAPDGGCNPQNPY